MTGGICLADWKMKRGISTKLSQWDCFLGSGETQEAITSEQRQRTYRDSQNQAFQPPAPSNTKKDVVCKGVPLPGDTAKGKHAFHGSFTEYGVEMLPLPSRTH